MEDLTRSKWNFSAIVAFMVIMSVNIIAGAAFLMGTITWQDWLAGTGSLNGIVLGWVSKGLTSE